MSDRPPRRLLAGTNPRLLLAAVVVVASVGGAAALAIQVVASAEDGNDDTRGNATAVEMNRTVNGTIDGPDDTDWYAVEVGDGKRLLAGITPNDTRGPDRNPPREYKDVSITIYGPDGEQLAHAETSMGGAPKTEAGVNHAVESGDTYYVEVESRYADEAENPEAQEANGSQDYELDVESVALDTNEPNDDAANATDLSTGETTSTNVLRTESDTFAVELEDGESVTVTYEVTARLNHDGASMPTKTTVVDPSGEEVAGSQAIDDEGPDAVSYTFTANESGAYVVTVTANTDEMAVSGVRGNDLTQYDLRLDVAEGSQDGGESTATPTATPPSEDDSSPDGGQDTQDSDGDAVEPDGTTDGGGDQSASDDGDDDRDGTRTATSVPSTATTTGTSASTPSGTDVPGQTEAPAEPTRTEQTTRAPGLPGFGFGIAIVGVSIAVTAAVRHRRQSDR